MAQTSDSLSFAHSVLVRFRSYVNKSLPGPRDGGAAATKVFASKDLRGAILSVRRAERAAVKRMVSEVLSEAVTRAWYRHCSCVECSARRLSEEVMDRIVASTTAEEAEADKLEQGRVADPLLEVDADGQGGKRI